MGSIHRRSSLVVAAALALLVTGCGPIADRRPSATLRVGYDTLDGTLQVWPARGALAGDAQAGAAVGTAVARWRTPVDDRVYLPSSGILWLGRVDDAPLALVAASVPGGGASWLLQLSAGADGAYRVDHATEYTDPGYLVYSDVLPVFLPGGRRYLTSSRVQRLLGPDGEPLRITDGLTGPVQVPSCTAVPLTASLRATESLPTGEADDRLLDLGTGIGNPRYPLVSDEDGAAGKALDGLDTCALAAKTGPFGSILRRSGERDEPQSVPDSWPIDKISIRTLATAPLDGTRVRIEQLDWRTDAGMMSAVVLRPEQGPAAASIADRVNALQTYSLELAGRSLAVLVWKADDESALSVPPGTQRLVDLPGLVIVPEPAEKQTFSLADTEKVYYRSLGGN
ncbi:hypothetical protein AB0J86_35405 [Micromonospora sp. NPDC049559]|uniref:hypothetical protein n=1 Tax=Micromonospora sp. NPDC049559 TaxID=3155923 RepID=UPI003443659C